ncbi:hypothetical protein U1Q18_027478 [Sarracenia purpurea var. burkii]
METNNSNGTSWADQWDYNSDPVAAETKKSGAGAGGVTAKYGKKVSEGLGKTKAAASTGVKKPFRRRSALPPSPPPKPMSKKSSSSKFTRSFQKLLRSIFGRKQTSNSLLNNDQREGSKDGFFTIYGGSDSLSAIPEVSKMMKGGGGWGGFF